MAYALRYYKELTHADGTVIRLEIHKKDSTTAAVEIGAVVQRLSLEIQGQQDDIDSPIQKTSLHMTFVDASDIENGQKNGFWQEFYTPDALMWKVILKAKDATETSFRTIWGGYVTPDSFSEDLVYRGSVSITARDNIGHMQDFPFDAEGDADGMISLYNLVESGWEKIQSPMMLEWRGEADSTMWLECDGVSAMFTLMNVSMFEGMDWYKAIETALASYGVVMRYVGNNIVKMSSLRSMPYQGAENIDEINHIEPHFITGAQRELVPAVKRIEESVDYDLGEEYQPRINTQDFSGNTFDVETSWGKVENIAWSLLQSAPMSAFGWYNETPFKTLAFNPSAYEVDDRLSDSDKEDLHKYTCVLTGSKDDNTHSLSYAMSVNAEDFAINVTFGKFLSRLTHGYGDYFLGYPANEPPAEFRVRFAVKVQANGVTSYLTEWGGWSTEFASQKVDVSGDKMSVNIPLSGKYTGKVLLSFVFLNIDTNEDAVRIKQILALSLSSVSNKPMLENNAVNTKYNENNNVILTRDPEIGPAYNEVALPAFIKNGIFYRSGDVILPAKKWSWGSGSEQQMAVWNHLQLLSYYAKPNNLISGTIVNADLTRARAIYMWHGAEHILISGTYNFLNGHIESAMLREFARYEDMWSEVAGAGLPDTEQDSRSNVEGGASGGGASSTYSNTTTVNIGSGGGGGTGASYLNDLLDVDATGVVAQSVLYYNGTSWVDMSLPTLLNPYLKADIAAQTYAKFSDLSALTTRVGANEGSIASLQRGKADKATTLAGYGIKDAYTTTQVDAKVQTINNALALRYTKTEVDGIVETINDALADRYTKEQTNSAISTALASYYTKTEIDGKVTTINNALADRYTKAQVDGIVTTINNSITSVDNKYASTKTWADTLASLIVNENGNIRIKTNLIINGDTASGGGSGETAIGITGILLNGTTYRDENGDGIIDLGTITSGLTSVNWSDVNGRPTALSQFNNDLGLGSLAYKNGLAASDVGALSTSGGTISGTTNNPLNLNTTNATEVGLSLAINSSKKAWFGYNTTLGSTQGAAYMYNAVAKRYMGILDDGSAFLGGNTLIHSGNIGSYKAGGISAGTITDLNSITQGASSVAIYESRDAANAPQNDGNGNVIECKWYEGQWQTQIFATMGTAKLYTRGYNASKGTWSDWKTIAFTDSDITGNAGSANALTLEAIGDLNSVTDNRAFYSYFQALNRPPSNYATGISLKHPELGYKYQLVFEANGGLFTRHYTSSWQSWKTIAFTDSTVAAANRIVTSNGKYMIYQNTNGHLYVGDNLGTSETFIIGGSVKLRYGTEAAYGFILNSSGNVTIGDSDLAGTSAKLYVDGRTYSKTGFLFEENYGIWKGRQWTGSLETTDIFYNATKHIFNSGNVGIGTTSPAYKLDVNGTARISGAVTMNSTLNVGGHTTINGNTSMSGVLALSSSLVTSGTIFLGNGNEGLYINRNEIAWHTNANGYKALLMSFSDTAITISKPTTINGDVRIKGNLIVDGDTASGGSAGTTTGVEIIPFVEINLYSILMMIQQSSDGKITQTQMDSAGLTEEVITQLMEGRVNQIKNTYSNGSSCSYSIENNGGQILLTIMSGTGGFNKYQKLISTGMWSKIS